MRISIAGTVDDVLKKYMEAEKISPAFERVTVFSWNDMLLLKAEIEKLRSNNKGLVAAPILTAGSERF